MAKGKSKSRSSPVFVKGGSGHMTGSKGGQQKPGITAAEGSGGKYGGGKGHMVGKQQANQAKPA